MTAIAAPRFLQSTVGKKVVMAVTGIILFGFTIVHMLGNLQIYLGPAKFNAYAHFLKSVPSLLWGTRAILFISVVLHIVTAMQLTALAGAARPKAYSFRRWRSASYASRTMMLSGPLLALFIVYHLLHFTTGQAHPHFIKQDAYWNFVTGFKVAWTAAAYVVCMLALGLHLAHGVYSASQSLGLRTARTAPVFKLVAYALTLVLVAANISMPIAVQAGVIKLHVPTDVPPVVVGVR